jgi:hypothetical protein
LTPIKHDCNCPQKRKKQKNKKEKKERKEKKKKKISFAHPLSMTLLRSFVKRVMRAI